MPRRMMRLDQPLKITRSKSPDRPGHARACRRSARLRARPRRAMRPDQPRGVLRCRGAHPDPVSASTSAGPTPAPGMPPREAARRLAAAPWLGAARSCAPGLADWRLPFRPARPDCAGCRTAAVSAPPAGARSPNTGLGARLWAVEDSVGSPGGWYRSGASRQPAWRWSLRSEATGQKRASRSIIMTARCATGRSALQLSVD